MNESPVLELENISRHFNIAGQKVTILDGINLSMNKGEIVSLTGKSGCGKSTLLNIISGIIRPDHGKIRLFGNPVFYGLDILSSRIRNRHMGFVFQTFRLVSNESVYSNVLLPLKIKGRITRQDREYVDTLLEKLEIATHRNHKAGLLSGGQKQRVAMARALVNRPGLILADEPTANLDKSTAIEIYKILEDLKTEGKTILVVTHQDYMFEHSDRVLELSGGKLTEVR